MSSYLLTINVQVIVQLLVLLGKKRPDAVRSLLYLLLLALLHRVEQEGAEHVGVCVLDHFYEIDVIELESGGKLVQQLVDAI